MPGSPLGTLTLPNGVKVGHDDSGIFLVGGGSFGNSPGYTAQDDGGAYNVAGGPMTRLPVDIRNNDFSFLDPSLQPYGQQLQNYYNNIISTENYGESGLSGFMMQYAPMIIAAMGGLGAAGMLPGAAGAAAGAGGIGGFLPEVMSGGQAAADLAGLGGTLGATSPTFAGNLFTQMSPEAYNLVPQTGANLTGGLSEYDQFLQSIGIDPASTQFSGGTLSNADIMSQIGGSGLGGLPNLPPGVGQILQSLMGGQQGGGAQGAGLNLGSLLPLLGVGSGLNSMFNQKPAVDPNMVKALWQAGQNTYNTALDPQNALYNRTAQQVQDQSRAGQSVRGLAMSPYGAGLEDQSMRNFNIDWQNNQLGRQAQGLQAFAGAGQVGAQSGLANNAQAFMQNQTGLNNLTTGLGQVFGTPGQNIGGMNFGGSAPNGLGSWLNNIFSSGGGGSLPAGVQPPYQQDLFTPTGNFGGADYGGVGSGMNPY